jgi:8-oxo-dGTP diphosphatase
MTSELPLYQRDPEAWRTHLAEGNAKQARKRVSADALIRDTEGQVLLVNPGYKPGWDLPGGMAEANEPPAGCIRREVKEELDLDLSVGPMLCVDWVPPHGPWDDLLAFVFDGGTLTREEIARIQLLDGELEAFGFFGVAEAISRLRPRAQCRARGALDALRTGTAVYLQDGRVWNPAGTT